MGGVMMNKVIVEYGGSQSKYHEGSVDYMRCVIDGKVLYSECYGEDNTKSYEYLKNEIIFQTESLYLDKTRLQFYYDGGDE
jgi:hypothetical protein